MIPYISYYLNIFSAIFRVLLHIWFTYIRPATCIMFSINIERQQERFYGCSITGAILVSMFFGKRFPAKVLLEPGVKTRPIDRQFARIVFEFRFVSRIDDGNTISFHQLVSLQLFFVVHATHKAFVLQARLEEVF